MDDCDKEKKIKVLDGRERQRGGELKLEKGK